IFNTSTINEVVRFSVFDRWGNRMYGVENVLPDSEEAQWDGTFGGEEVNPGVYMYRMVLDINGEQEVVMGDLTVM
ncbi:MAG: gliding motility-associated C-terminal domain-containing protein, partial [Bacteroidota bacterium]